MRYCHVSQDQLLAALHTLHSVTSVEELSLDSVPLSRVSDDELSRAVSRVHHLDLNNTGLSHSQLSQLLVHLPLSRVQSLSLSGQNLSGLAPGLLCLPCDQVTSLDLANASLTETQISALLTAIIWSDTIEVRFALHLNFLILLINKEIRTTKLPKYPIQSKIPGISIPPMLSIYYNFILFKRFCLVKHYST